jgi:hypothetical protein
MVGSKNKRRKKIVPALLGLEGGIYRLRCWEKSPVAAATVEGRIEKTVECSDALTTISTVGAATG